MRRNRPSLLIGFLILAGGLLMGYENCTQTKFTTVHGSSVITGNPMSSSAQLLFAVCSVINRCNPGATFSDCQAGILPLAINTQIGLPASSYPTFAAVVQGEQAGSLIADQTALSSCSTAINSLSCGDPAVVAAYDSTSANPFAGAASLFPSQTNSCPQVFAKGYKSFLYVANRTTNNISVFSINEASGAISEIAGSPFVAGSMPWGFATDPGRQFLYVANLNSNVVNHFSVAATTGFLSPVPGSPYPTAGPAWSMAVHPNAGFAYVTIYGSDKISIYARDAASGALTLKTSISTGTNPSGLVLDKAGAHAYVSINGASSVAEYSVNSATGLLTSIGTVAAGASPNGAAISPDEKFVFVGNSGSQDVYTYSVDSATGALSQAGSPAFIGGSINNVTVDPTGSYLYAVAGSPTPDVVTGFKIDQNTGSLTQLPSAPFAAGADPHDITVEPTGHFVYVANRAGNSISVYSLDPTTGALTPVAGSPFPLTNGSGPNTLLVLRIPQS